MENSDNTNIVDSLPLDEQTTEVANQILAENDIDKIKDLTNLFNLNQRKKNVIRLMKFEGLLDKISDQMVERLEKKSDEFSNSDLLDYMSTVQSTIDRTQKSLDMISDTPAIQINQQNNINITSESDLSREEREHVAQAVSAILSRIKKNDIILGEDINGDRNTDT